MQTGPRVTLIDIILAVAAREARRTQTSEGVDTINTGATIEAGAGGRREAGKSEEYPKVLARRGDSVYLAATLKS